MLVLTMKTKDIIHVDENIKVCLLGIKGNQAMIGFDAPSHVKIFRDKLLNKIKGHSAINTTAGNLTENTNEKC